MGALICLHPYCFFLSGSYAFGLFGVAQAHSTPTFRDIADTPHTHTGARASQRTVLRIRPFTPNLSAFRPDGAARCALCAARCALRGALTFVRQDAVDAVLRPPLLLLLLFLLVLLLVKVRLLEFTPEPSPEHAADGTHCQYCRYYYYYYFLFIRFTVILMSI